MSIPERPERSTSGSPRLLETLVGAELGSVVFVMDYIQFNFQPVGASGRSGRLSTYTLPRLIDLDGVIHHPGSPGYRDGLIDLIPHVVSHASEVAAELRIDFDNGRRLVVSLTVEDGVDVEAAMLTLADPDEWEVWRPGDIRGH